MHATGNSTITVLRNLVANEGYMAFTRGMGATLAKAFVVNAAIFYGYGVASRSLEYMYEPS